jgi:hypothetical protein
MNLSVPKYNTDLLNLHFLLEDSSDGWILGTVAELPGCQVTAATEQEAIDELERMTRDRLAKMTVVPFSMAIPPEVEQKKNPWLKYMGMYEGDADFAAIAAELRAVRGLEELSWDK